MDVLLSRDRVRQVLMADLIGSTDSAVSPSSLSLHLTVSRVARALGVRLSSPFPVFADGVSEQFMMALRLLAFASSDSSDAQHTDEELLIKAMALTPYLEIRAMDILAETLKTSMSSLTRTVEINDGVQYPPRSLVFTLAQHKLRILTDCQQWAKAYRNKLIVISPS